MEEETVDKQVVRTLVSFTPDYVFICKARESTTPTLFILQNVYTFLYSSSETYTPKNTMNKARKKGRIIHHFGGSGEMSSVCTKGVFLSMNSLYLSC
jgi:hypothetical protein